MSGLRWIAAAALAAATACGGDTPPGAADAGVDAGAPDARPPEGDSLPLGSISFFKTTTCPDGWVDFTSGVGRFIVPTVGPTLPGTERGTALASGEDRTHTHEIGASVETGSVSYVGIVGGGNGGVSPAGTYGFETTTAEASAGLPYVQLLVCFKSAPPAPGSLPVPRGTLLFFRSQCPTGWSQAPSTQGRFLVGVPAEAPPGVPFGGETLAEGEERRHEHTAAGQVDTGSHGIALASGCCGGGYARAGTYGYSTTSTQTAISPPSLDLLQCRKD